MKTVLYAIGCILFVGLGCLGIYAHDTGNGRLAMMSFVMMFGSGWVWTIPSLLPMWRGDTHEARMKDVPPSTWPYSLELWQGWVRSTFIYGVLAGPMFVVLGLMIGIGEWDWPIPRERLGERYDPLMGLAVLFFVVVNGLGLSVIVFNRPKWAVPPSMRDQHPWITNLDSY